ncbi:MAG TPA: methylated-DNA--[protein]-cysteine S-methyltransferase [Streptosporangiaceae bacterium]|jgi:methylated-DNA-[protein]-cysteine S-methyltransferase|nr:methylated-DNA--[protein]-cysteine S-methyltransferase [Streptosporangiaceae bacterium]
MTGPTASSDPFVPADPAAQHFYTRVGSPIGELLLIGREDALTGLYMLGGPHGSTAQVPPGARRDAGALAAVTAQLDAYFSGERREFDVGLAPAGSPFQLAVWAELTRIPYGTTISYGTQTTRLGKPLSASRAVGAANGQNPISVIVPCHRVIGADGSLTGYGGGLDRKETLLRLEGAPAMHALDATLW